MHMMPCLHLSGQPQQWPPSGSNPSLRSSYFHVYGSFPDYSEREPNLHLVQMIKPQFPYHRREIGAKTNEFQTSHLILTNPQIQSFRQYLI